MRSRSLGICGSPRSRSRRVTTPRRPSHRTGWQNAAARKLDLSAKAFNDAEGRIAELLLSEGKNVKALKESTVPGVRTADSEVNGVPTEFKSLIPGAAANTVKNQLNSAKGQARHAIIDARASGLSESAAQEGLGKFLRNNPPGRMDFIRIVGDGYDITYP
ncbi:hypothetical protein [Streptomyces sp. NPDC056796]|uniref:CdiA C-terminal domain-containing protein n=1 Tax=Streptomyces sp. NPDC056796 TaxID=3345947 RepID=UPI00369032D0